MSRLYLVVISLTVVALIISGINLALRTVQNATPASQQLSDEARQSAITATESDANATSGTVSTTITYSDSGFSPSTLRVANGTTVTFINQSRGLMRVASNPHPSHNSYPGFDAKSGLSRGQSYKFTFSNAGIWSYHNHLETGQGGTVIVR